MYIHGHQLFQMALRWSNLIRYLTSIWMLKRQNTKRSHTGVEEITKPVMIEDYNQYMGVVDLS